MKTLITIINLFVFIIMSYGQDDLWLTTSSESVIIKEVYAPERDCNPNADKDLFVIYDDGTHYNSRGVEPRPFRDISLYSTAGPSAGHLGIKATDGNRIRFLYLSNLYEGDDPPRSIDPDVDHEGLEIGVTNDVPNYGFYANHSVRPGYDITLIKIGRVDKNQHIIKIKEVGSRNFISANIDDYFSQSYFPGELTNYIDHMEAGYEIHYINLMASDDLNRDNVDSVRFIINGDSLTESVDNVFDPNYIELQSICGPYYRYKVAIRNNGRAIAQDVALIVTLPFKFKSVEVNSIDMGDYQFPSVRSDPIDVVRFDGREPHFSHNKKTINFLFENAKLSNCKTVKGKQLADGYIIFTVKKSPDDELTRVDEVKPTFAQSTMWAYHSGDGESFTIDKFEVATKIGKNDDEDKILNVGCKKPKGTKVISVKECSFLNRFFKNCK